MMGGPIDTRQAPTAVNTLATQRPFSWFEQNVIATIPMIYPGSGRKVYPGFLQLAGFMTMNLGSHLISHWEMFKHLVVGDDESASGTQKFYDEYRSVCDMTAEFYLQTVDVVFQRHLLPKGQLEHRGRLVDPAAIRDTALLAIEGERDDISGIGQTKAALDIATGLSKAKKQYFFAEGCRPLRHFQWPQVARKDRSASRGLHHRQRLTRFSGAANENFASQGREEFVEQSRTFDLRPIDVARVRDETRPTGTSDAREGTHEAKIRKGTRSNDRNSWLRFQLSAPPRPHHWNPARLTPCRLAKIPRRRTSTPRVRRCSPNLTPAPAAHLPMPRRRSTSTGARPRSIRISLAPMFRSRVRGMSKATRTRTPRRLIVINANVNKAVQAALRIDPNLPEAHALLASIYYLTDYDWPGADREYRWSIKHDQKNAQAHSGLAQLLARSGDLTSQ